jgi:catechol 2,3-dioxygenase-like lactoylglutathione lyase family enzyme
MSADARRPAIDCERMHATLYVADVFAAVDYYTAKLGFDTGFTWGEPVSMAGLNFGQVQIFIEGGGASADGVTLYFVVGNADELHAFHAQNGVEIAVRPDDREYSLRDYTVLDPYGNRLTFGHYIYTSGPKLRIERTDVPLRLEKRLAALVHDLAAYKHMSVDSLMEEILLHSCEHRDGNVASPHTLPQLRYIDELKKKHGIDYDTHASYRFEE